MSIEAENPTGPWAKPTILHDRPSARTAVIRRDDMTMDGLRAMFDSAFGPIVDALGAAGARPGGPAFARYEGDLSGEFAIEVGFPVDGDFDEPSRVGEQLVIPSSLPGGRVAAYSHIGPYDDLGTAWGKLAESVAAHGNSIGQPMWEVYVTEPRPDMDPATLRTDLFVVVDRTG